MFHFSCRGPRSSIGGATEQAQVFATVQQPNSVLQSCSSLQHHLIILHPDTAWTHPVSAVFQYSSSLTAAMLSSPRHCPPQQLFCPVLTLWTAACSRRPISHWKPELTRGWEDATGLQCCPAGWVLCWPKEHAGLAVGGGRALWHRHAQPQSDWPAAAR